MAEHSLHALMEPPDGVARAASIIAGLDRCLLLGFGRLGADQAEALDALGRVLAGTPLGGPLDESLAALRRMEFVDRHFSMLAAARAALQGAQHDALRSQVLAALGRPAEGATTAPPEIESIDGPSGAWLESTRHWLMELALAGFKNLDEQAIAPFAATLERLQSQPHLARLAALLVGFRRELLHALPISSLPAIPIYRWADLWTRAMIATRSLAARPASRPVSGRFSPLGLDLRQHGNFVSADVYGLFDEPGQPPRVLRTTASSYKVDAVRADEVWTCFDRALAPLVHAAPRGVAQDIKEMPLLDSGDLVWCGETRHGPPFDRMKLAATRLAPGASIVTPCPVPADRHPIQLAEPVFLEGYEVATEGELALIWNGATRLRVAVERPLPGEEPMFDLLTRTTIVQRSSSMIGLLRFDGGAWCLQPLGVQGAEDVFFVGAPEPAKPKGKKAKESVTLTILRERAGRLLRKKS